MINDETLREQELDLPWNQEAAPNLVLTEPRETLTEMKLRGWPAVHPRGNDIAHYRWLSSLTLNVPYQGPLSKLDFSLLPLLKKVIYTGMSNEETVSLSSDPILSLIKHPHVESLSIESPGGRRSKMDLTAMVSLKHASISDLSITDLALPTKLESLRLINAVIQYKTSFISQCSALRHMELINCIIKNSPEMALCPLEFARISRAPNCNISVADLSLKLSHVPNCKLIVEDDIIAEEEPDPEDWLAKREDETVSVPRKWRQKTHEQVEAPSDDPSSSSL